MMTALVALITASAVLVLGFVAASIDSRSRTDDVDRLVASVAGGLARAIQHDDNQTLDLTTVIDDKLAQGPTSVVVAVRKPGEQWRQAHTYQRSLMPSDSDIATIATRTEDHSDGQMYDTLLTTTTDITGRSVRVAATPIYWTDWDNVVVILAAAESMTDPGDHRRLVWALMIGGALLIALATAAAYLLAGRSVRAALHMLDQHEQFLGDAAHELRTPLTTLKLLTESKPKKPEDVDQTLAEARRLADRMARLVTGLLARARMQAGIAAPERTMLRLDQLAEAVAEEAGDPRITVAAHPTVVVGDPELLTLAIKNMLENGLTHGAVNRAAPVEVHVAEGRVSVRDHGPGVDPVMSANPFDRGAAGRTGRNGIGLALVAWVAQTHGGNASIEPAVGGGTIATLWLPPADITAGTLAGARL